MIAQLVDIINIAAGTLPIIQRHGLAQIVAGAPYVHVGGGDWVPVTVDGDGSWSYVRINGQTRIERIDVGESCLGARVTIPLRLVGFMDRESCNAVPGLLIETANSIRAAREQARQAVGAIAVNFSTVSMSVDDFIAQEYQPVPNVPTGRVMVALDMVVQVEGREDCFVGCGNIIDVVCAVIQGASNGKVVECLGPERLAEICGIDPPPCDPLLWELKDEDGNLLDSGAVGEPCGGDLQVTAPSATVLRDGEPFGAVLSGGTIDVPSDCPPPEPCPDLCDLLGEVEPENVEAEVYDCLTEAAQDALKEAVCDPCPEPCPVTVRIFKNEELIAEVEDLDPCENHTINVTCDGDD